MTSWPKIVNTTFNFCCTGKCRYEHPGTEVLLTYAKGVHQFLDLQNRMLYLSVQDPCSPPPTEYNQRKCVSLWTASGRKKVSYKYIHITIFLSEILNFTTILRIVFLLVNSHTNFLLPNVSILVFRD